MTTFFTSYDIHVEVIFFPSTTALFMGNKTKPKQALSKIKKQHKALIMHPLKVYSTSVTVLQERGLATKRMKYSTGCSSLPGTISITSSILLPRWTWAAPRRSSSSVHGAFRRPHLCSPPHARAKIRLMCAFI